uniref:Uncharacterized protein n=1 Tax=Corethron hystrix TaxID=216773 RepID=A0A7S1FZJ9_9STRA|mmetsp:Transcript_42798/g.100490  ORF Transcript_42798/g.100490 Transcript_42798/m.100490 type:complete len:483 (+) Transcript_42798:13-1461(+)
MVHRCSSKSVKHSVKLAGKQKAFKLLCEIVDKYRHYPKEHAHGSTIVCKVTKIFNHFTRANCVKLKMAENYDINFAIVKIIENDHVGETEKLNALNILTELACCDNAVSVLIHVKGLTDALSECAHSSNVKIRNLGAMAFLNLSAVSENKQILGWDKNVIDSLSKCMCDDSESVRKSAISAIGNISSCIENKRRLVNYENGVFLHNLLRITRSDTEKDLRLDAVNVLSNLTNANTSAIMCDYSNLFPTLATLASDDYNWEIQKAVMKFLRRLSPSINATLPNYSNFLEALFISLTGKNVIKQIISILKDQASHHINRSSLASFPDLLDTLALLSLTYNSLQASIVKTLLFISHQCDGSTFILSETILNALTTALDMIEGRNMITCYAAMKTIRKLAVLDENRKLMEKKDSLFSALTSSMEKKAKIVSITDSLAEFLYTEPTETCENIISALEEDTWKFINNDAISELAGETLLVISGNEMKI